MRAFWIIAAVLTAAYVFYYAVMICIDLWRKPGEERKSEEETFELKDTAPVPGRFVEVTDRGFRVGGGTGPDVETVMAEMPSRTAVEVPDSPPAPMFDACGAPITPGGRKIQAAREDMDEIDPACSGEMTHQMLTESMTSGGSTVPLDKNVTPPEKSSGDANPKNEQDHDGGQRI